MKKLFGSATMRLTLWYMLILMVLSLLFSSIVFQIASQELHRPYGQKPTQTQSAIGNDDAIVGNGNGNGGVSVFDEFEQLRAAREKEGKQRLIVNLVIFNATTIAAGGLASYFLARRTLRPIEEALDAQTRFTSDAAHELRTPLAVMQSEIEIGLRDKKPNLSKQRDLLESNLDEVGRLRSLTDRLLLLSNFKTVDTSPTALDEVATEAINRVFTLAQAKHIGIESTIRKQKAVANADILTDMLVILLDNAIKYSPKKSTVTISAKEQGKHTLVEVADNGNGIDAKDLPHIFDRFYRADTSRSKVNVEGHGLGLSIAKRSIEAMGGAITVASTPGKGTTFSLHLTRSDS